MLPMAAPREAIFYGNQADLEEGRFDGRRQHGFASTINCLSIYEKSISAITNKTRFSNLLNYASRFPWGLKKETELCKLAVALYM